MARSASKLSKVVPIVDRPKRATFDRLEVEKSVWLLMKGLGMDAESEHFRGTPARVARGYFELLEGSFYPEKVVCSLATSFSTSNTEMIVTRRIRASSLCPHHLLPIAYCAVVGYIPDGRALGLSKVARVVKLLAARAVIQEDLTTEIGNVLLKELKPKGVMVVLNGQHNCMRIRGIKSEDSSVVTSFVSGVFRKDTAKQEFFRLASLP